MPEETVVNAGANGAAAPNADSTPAGNNAQNSTPPATSGSSAATEGNNADGKGTEQHVPYDRFSAVVEQKNSEKAAREAAEERVRSMEEELNKLRPPAQKAPTSIWDDPDAYMEQRVNDRLAPLQNEVEYIKSEKVESSIKTEYDGSPELKKLYPTFKDLATDIAKTASGMGVKKMDANAKNFAYTVLMAKNAGKIAQVAKELGREEERTQREIVKNGGLPNGSKTPDKGQPQREFSKEEVDLYEQLTGSRDMTKVAEKLGKAERNEKGTRIAFKHNDL